MKNFLPIFLLSLLCVACTEETKCTTEPKSQWKDQAEFKQSLKDQGYKINEFKVTSGNCYEIYGWDKEKNKVEIYFNPVSGDVVKSEKH